MLSKELEEHRGKMTMQSLLADLQKKLEAEIENLRVARDQKQEIQENLRIAREQKGEI